MSSDIKHPLTFREATLADATHLAHIINQGFRSERTGQTWLFDDQSKRIDIVSEEVTASVIGADDSVMLVGFAPDDAEAVACCFARAPSEPALPHMTEGASWFGLLAVLPKYQGRGYGKALLIEAESFVQRKWNVRRLEMDYVNARIELGEWYRRCGYVDTQKRREFPYGDGGREILADGLEMVVIGKDL